MAIAKKTKTTAKTSSKADAPAKQATAAKKSSKLAAPARKTATVAAPAKKAAKSTAPAAATAADAGKPIKSAFSKSGLIAHLAEASGADLKTTRAIMASLEATMLASVHKKGLGSFTLPGLLKVNVINVPAKKKRTGIDPFTKQERDFAAKPATVRVKSRALKKLKDAAA